jgi:thiol:disulfide interchange protein DsbD
MSLMFTLRFRASPSLGRHGLRALALLACWWVLAPLAWAADTFLPVDQAFRLEAQAGADGALELDFTAAPGTYLYRERMRATVRPASVLAEPLSLPAGDKKFDETFGKELEVYHGPVTARLRLQPGVAAGTPAWVEVVYQGCADAGLCYPPQKRHFKLTVGEGGKVLSVDKAQAEDGQSGSTSTAQAAGITAPSGTNGINGTNTASASADSNASDPSDSSITQALASGSVFKVAGVFFLAGMLLSLTPCVLPMVPILSSIIVGQQGTVSRGRGLALALAYSQGMALVYTALGVAAGLLGQGLAAYLQHPWVLLGFAALMVLLALSMFGLYELQLPVSVQSWLGAGSSKLPGGKFVSVFAMGVVSALVVSPCVSAPLAGALLYISQSGNVALGGSALYAMAWGMSMPLLLVGVSAGSLLPRSGPWMTRVKALFGLLMLGMAVWIARPAWPFLVAQVSGQQAQSAHQSALPFQRVRSVAELDAAVKAASAQGKPVMLDFYADWCVACIEMERDTFTDAGVKQRLAKAVLLQADVTANNADDRALLQRFSLFGPPGILFFDPQGRPIEAAKVVGFQKPERFVKALQAAGL